LSRSQDNEIGDGTTGVVVLAGALLEQAQVLLDKGIHPLKIADGFEKACEMAVKRVESIATELDIEANEHEELIKCAMTALGSKVVSKQKRQLAEIAVKAVLSVADMERRDVNFDLIKIVGKTGGSLQDTSFIDGIVIDKDFSHPQMAKEVNDAKICILTCPFEPPKLKTKHNLEIKTKEDYEKLYEIEQKYFTDMVASVKDSGANLVLCQWGFDDEANHLLMHNKLPAVRWVGGVEIELIAIATGGRIIPRFQEITPEKLGKAGHVKEVQFGTTNERMIVIEKCSNSRAVTILVRGGNKMIVAEAQRCLHDAICVVRNMIKNHKIVPGGGATELACSLHIQEQADKIESIEQYSVKGFAEALEEIPLALATNSGYNSIQYVSDLKEQQVTSESPYYGVDAMNSGNNQMIEEGVYESVMSKKQQLQLATQVVKMIMKIDDVIAPAEYE
jgi:T-complex protein 1 subunit epsilon